jgi:hypothetical protein
MSKTITAGGAIAGRRVGGDKRFGARWNVVRFLSCGGAILIILGLAGVSGFLGSRSHASLFNPPYWINWFHL